MAHLIESDGKSYSIKPLFEALVISSALWRELDSSLPFGVNLLAVSKGHPESSIRFFAELGQRDFGESRLQEALPKILALSDQEGLRWHFIGRLQANKVRGVVRAFEVIHSVDSLRLAERISRIAGEENRCPDVMLQVKFKDDPTKGGFDPDELLKDWAKMIGLSNLHIIGLMTMPPLGIDLNQRRQIYKDCRDLADKLSLSDCSMGMSQDWHEALDAGATWLRLGSALFGVPRKNVDLHKDVTKGD